jgi:hypothetical protein
MQNQTKARREYEMKKTILAEQEGQRAAKMELKEAMAVEDEEKINAGNH